jgi:CRISPR-associated protein Csb1
MTDLAKFDKWISDDGPAALVIRENLQSADGSDGVVFPPTFATGDNFPGGYNIDDKGPGPSVCLIDSVGSQANRIEPLFMKGKYASLVPQIVVKAGEKQVNLLEAGHRAGDAIVRCSALKDDLQKAFKAVLNGDTEPLAKIAPTSLVFGVWDSRDTQAKLPRLINSVIRAYDVQPLTRSAQYVPAASYVDSGLLPQATSKAESDVYAQRGFVHVPASAKPGGVKATGGIRRDATLSLAALRLLTAGRDAKKTLAMQRYVLGLALTAFTHSPSGYLRQGCLLVADPDRPREFVEVYVSGERVPATLTHANALEFAASAAEAFGVGKSREVEFDKERALKDLKGDSSEAKPTAKEKRRTK